MKDKLRHILLNVATVAIYIAALAYIVLSMAAIPFVIDYLFN